MTVNEPTLLIDLSKVDSNIQFMVDKADRVGKSLRPHFKTHQCRDIGQRFKPFGVEKIAVSSLSMAEHFSPDWQDIFVAIGTNPNDHQRINRLTRNINLTLGVTGLLNIEALSKVTLHPVNIMLKLDTGYGRSGVLSSNSKEIHACVEAIHQHELMNFAGFFSHAGNSYGAPESQDLQKIHQNNLEQLSSIRSQFSGTDFIISTGDTPTFCRMDDFGIVDELRPGNAVYFDVMQMKLGSCQQEQIACCLACPVIDIHPERQQVVVHGGGVHLSKERLNLDGQDCYGYVVPVSERGWGQINEENKVVSLSQEHGILQLSKNLIDSIKIGDTVGVLPIHSCMTVSCNNPTVRIGS